MTDEKAESEPTLVDKWIKDKPNHPLLPEAYLLRGDAYSAAEDHFKALFDYEQVIRVYPESPQFEVAMRRELIIAQMFSRGIKRKFLGLRFIPTDSEAEELFIRIQERSPGSAIAEEAPKLGPDELAVLETDVAINADGLAHVADALRTERRA